MGNYAPRASRGELTSSCAVCCTWLTDARSSDGVRPAAVPLGTLDTRRPAMVILAIDLGKAKSVFCWYEGADQSHAFKTVASTPQAFHDALVGRPAAAAAAAAVVVVVVEACDGGVGARPVPHARAGGRGGQRQHRGLAVEAREEQERPA